MSTNVSFNLVSLVFQSGCKSRKLISNWQMFFEVFFKKISFPFSLLNPASLSMNFPRFAGCKCNIRFLIPQAFLNLFLKKKFQTLILNACRYIRERLSLLRVQKYHLYLHLQGFLLYNFHIFYNFFLTH